MTALVAVASSSSAADVAPDVAPLVCEDAPDVAPLDCDATEPLLAAREPEDWLLEPDADTPGEVC